MTSLLMLYTPPLALALFSLLVPKMAAEKFVTSTVYIKKQKHSISLVICFEKSWAFKCFLKGSIIVFVNSIK